MVFFILIIITSALITSGCVSQLSNENKSTEITVFPSTISANSYPSDWVFTYNNNLSPAMQKIPPELHQIIDPNYPKEHIYFTKKDLGRSYYFIPAENASQMFDISKSQALANGGEIKVQINLQPSASLDVVDPYITKIIDKNEKWHDIGAWVGLNNLEKIASLPEVKKIILLYPATKYTDNYLINESQMKKLEIPLT